jgi:hypothetical protein
VGGEGGAKIRIWAISTESDLLQEDGCSIAFYSSATVTFPREANLCSIALERAGVDLNSAFIGINSSAKVVGDVALESTGVDLALPLTSMNNTASVPAVHGPYSVGSVAFKHAVVDLNIA